MKSFLKNYLPLISVLALAAVLRFFLLGQNPIGFNDDEAAFGYNAYSILKTARDEWGRVLPFPVFESFGDWKLVFYLYAAVVSQFIFGANEFATRFPSALFGVLSVFATYFLGKKLFDKKIGTLAALLLAISPWHVIASRNAFESDVLIFFITLGTYLFLEGLFKGRKFIFSIFCFGICFYIYRSSWLFVPLFVGTLVIFFRKELVHTRASLIKYVVLALLIISPLVPTILSFRGQSRFLQESFINGVAKVGIINEINEKRGVCAKNTNDFVCSVIYNKLTSYIATYVNNYIENLSPSNYFTKGTAGGYQSFSNRGLFYSFELLLLILGIIYILATKNRNGYILIAWIMLVPVGAAFTGVGNPGRLNIFMPAVQIIEASGLIFAAASFKKLLNPKLLYSTVFLIAAFSLMKFAVDMFIYYPQISARAQRYGYKELFQYLHSQENNFTQIAVSRQGDDAKQYMHYLFFNKIDPKEFLSSTNTQKQTGKDNWIDVKNIGNVYFYSSSPGIDDLPPKSLLALPQAEVNFPTKPKKVVTYPNGDKFFEIYDVDEVKLINASKNEE